MASSRSVADNEGMLAACFLGFQCPYDETLAHMHARHHAIAEGAASEILLLEHEAVITLTRQHQGRSIKTSREAIEADGIHVAIADRGGDATFHGPGQLVGYPLINLGDATWRMADGGTDIERYIRSLESSLLRSMHALGFTRALVAPGFTGIWYRCDDGAVSLKKLIAIGVGIKDGVTKHGFALNIDIDHRRFSKHIVPCGLKDRGVTTLKEIAKRDGLHMPSRDDIMTVIVNELADCFGLARAPVHTLTREAEPCHRLP